MTDARVAEAFISALSVPSADLRVAEAFISALVVGPSSGANIAEAFISAVVYRGPCSTQRADMWLITRKDGQQFAFTSHDSDIDLGGITYKHCASLADSAAESTSELGATASVALTGILSDASITDEDIYAGLFDDAEVDVFRVDWGDNGDPTTPYYIAGGQIGTIQFGQIGWKAEVLGPGERMRQTAIVDFYQPGCRWNFGHIDQRCGIDDIALQIRDITFTGGTRGLIQFAPMAPPSDALWNGGTLVWTYGKNAGFSCEVDTADLASGVLSLWDLCPFPPQVGDEFDLRPGCPKDKASCVFYDNLVNFGGFDLVPGPDALQQNADALFA